MLTLQQCRAKLNKTGEQNNEENTTRQSQQGSVRVLTQNTIHFIHTLKDKL